MLNSIIDIHDKLLNAGTINDFADALNLNGSLDRQISIGEVTDDTGAAIDLIIRYFNKLDDELKIPVEERKPIKIYIDSDGGDLHSCFTIVDVIRLSKTPIITINIGKAYSAGFFIFISGHKRYSYPSSTFLYHEGSVSSGLKDAGKFQNYADYYNKLMEKIKDITLKNTKLTEEKYNEIKKDDFWIFADEAIELGICDEIITNLM